MVCSGSSSSLPSTRYMVHIRSIYTEAFSSVHFPASIHAGIVYIRQRPIQKHLAAFTFLLAFMQVQLISDLDLYRSIQQHSLSCQHLCRYSNYIRQRPIQKHLAAFNFPASIHAGIVDVRSRPIQEHLAAFTFLLAFMQVQFISDLDLYRSIQQHSLSCQHLCRYSNYIRYRPTIAFSSIHVICIHASIVCIKY